MLYVNVIVIMIIISIIYCTPASTSRGSEGEMR